MSLHASLETARTTETAAAVMRTLTSPTLVPAMPCAVWRTDLPAGSTGPDHAIDSDQFVIVLNGAIDVLVDQSAYSVAAGDGIKLPAGVSRTVGAANGAPASTLTVGQPGVRATVGDREAVPVPWTE